MSVIFTQSLSFHYVPNKDEITYIMSHPNSTSNYILQHGIFESELIQLCRDKLCSSEKIFVDIGAHIGTYSMNLAPYFSHTYAFEAQKSTYYMLCGNVALNSLTDKITTKHCAVSNYENDGKMVHLKIVSEDGGGSTIKDFSHHKILSEESVISKPLDYFQLSNIGLIKMDVEGSERDVLQGALKTLEKNNYPPILFEAWNDDWYSDEKVNLMAYLTELGYKIEILFYTNMFLATKI